MDWAEEYRSAQEEERRKARLQIADRLNYDPERASRVFGVAAKTNLPSEVVDADLENLEESLRAKSFNYDNYTDVVNGAKVFNDFAAESPYNYAVLERDRKNLTQIERTVEDIFLGWDSGRATTQLADLRNAEIRGESKPEDQARMKELHQLLEGGDFGAGNPFTKTLVGTARQLPIMGWITKEGIDEAALGALTYGTVAMGITGASGGATAPAIVPAMGLGAGHGFLIGRSEATFRLERGLAYDEYRSLGFDDKDSLLFANAVGGVNAALESIGFGALTKRLPGFNRMMSDKTGAMISEVFSKPTMKHSLARFTLQYGEAMATEVVTEIAQETTLMLGREHMKAVARDAGDIRPETEPLHNFVETWKETALHTMYGVALIGGLGPIANYRADSRLAAAATEQQELWKMLGEAAEESTTRESASDVWKEFVSRVQEKGSLKEILVDGEGWRSYWQSKEIDPEAAAKELGIDLPGAEAIDTDIRLPFDVFIDKIAPTEHLQGLMKDLRVREDEMTMREAEKWQADKKKHIEDIKQALGEAYDPTIEEQIVEDLAPQLVASGKYTEKAATEMAQFHAITTMNLAQRGNKDPWDYYKQTLEGVFSEVPESLAAAGEDIDMDMDPLLDRIRNNDFPKQREIYGESLIDLIRSAGGIMDDGGEISARDLNKIRPGTVSKEGKSIDAIAELAAEAGYIAEYDSNLLLEALDREIGGTPVFGLNAQVNRDLEELLAQLEVAADFLSKEGIDLDTMSNAEVRKKLEGITTLEQSDTESLKEWGDLLEAVSQVTTEMKPNEVDTMLAVAEATMPRVSGAQNFKDVEFTDRVTINGKEGEVTYSAQEAYDEAVRSRNVLKQLAKCVDG